MTRQDITRQEVCTAPDRRGPERFLAMSVTPAPRIPPIVITAQAVVYAEKWRLCEQAAADRLARCVGLAWTSLLPRSSAFHLVAFDGQVLGRVYAVHPPRFDAVLHGGFRIGTYPSLEAAAKALARACGCR